ncbi:hypothetical protein [Pseudalkalibacillus caeni]|uniref:Macro domain-containing protein n=1 Tax=Exobacillus caeni TaxID=2574798 RepID=A0A5R9FEZ4_9BACL|nr:hypothetical protein [Pseudalkalibacillus caeni]TLS38145.1 hypothetical protein FCL54_06285 [Pseudalkalibacillus caeni]
MIRIKKGDIFKSDCSVIAHQCDCFNSMEEGLGKRVKQMYPEAAKADEEFPFPPKKRLGKCSFAVSGDHKRVIANLYGQYRPQGLQTNYPAWLKSFEKMIKELTPMEDKGFPVSIACGIDKDDFENVKKSLEKLSKKYKRTIEIYPI